MTRKILAIIFVISWFAVIYIAGAIEQSIIDIDTGMLIEMVLLTTMFITGFKSKILEVPR